MKRIMIIGGGVVGLFTAWYLRESGAEIIIADSGDMTDGCSYGNAGLIVPSHIVPFASPHTLHSAMKNLFNPRSSISVRMSADPGLLRWYFRFMLSATAKHVKESIPALRDLSLFSKSLYGELKAAGELDFPLWDDGLMMLYRSGKVGETLLEEAEMARREGLEVSDFEPGRSAPDGT